MVDLFEDLIGVENPWRAVDAPEPPAEDFRVETEDGVSLRLRRRSPDGSPRGPAVMLLHGLAANHRAFHLRERSLAEWLVERGYEVWLPELRGHGESRVERLDWGLDEYLEFDLPAILSKIRDVGEHTAICWVGHSMGGVLLFCYGILNPDAPIDRGVTVGSALDYRIGESAFEQLLGLKPVLKSVRGVPYGAWMRALAPAMGRGPDLLHEFNVWPSNIEDRISRAIHARCFHTIPVSLLESLSTTFESDGLRLRSGFSFLEHVDRFDVPVRLLAGSRDRQVAVEAVEHTAELLEGPADTVVHGPDRGDVDHYGHWDLLVGRRAPRETWPQIEEWLPG